MWLELANHDFWIHIDSSLQTNDSKWIDSYCDSTLTRLDQVMTLNRLEKILDDSDSSGLWLWLDSDLTKNDSDTSQMILQISIFLLLCKASQQCFSVMLLNNDCNASQQLNNASKQRLLHVVVGIVAGALFKCLCFCQFCCIFTKLRTNLCLPCDGLWWSIFYSYGLYVPWQIRSEVKQTGVSF